jgi:hypothetical protein
MSGIPSGSIRPGREPLTGVCSNCGQVFWVDEGHSCSGRTRAGLLDAAGGAPVGASGAARAALRLAA